MKCKQRVSVVRRGKRQITAKRHIFKIMSVIFTCVLHVHGTFAGINRHKCRQVALISKVLYVYLSNCTGLTVMTFNL